MHTFIPLLRAPYKFILFDGFLHHRDSALYFMKTLSFLAAFHSRDAPRNISRKSKLANSLFGNLM